MSIIKTSDMKCKTNKIQFNLPQCAPAVYEVILSSLDVANIYS